ncbi:MAG: hypothetical protein IIA45_01825 [Bacteroidetes bacterium]|nr:hypothetical protein [Bacteroidota bacterium]
MDLDLPNLTFNVARIQPFKQKTLTGQIKWYERFGFSYTSRFKNQVSFVDSTLFDQPSGFNFNENNPALDIRNGIEHKPTFILPNFSLFKHFHFTPSIQYKERWYFDHIEKSYDTTLKAVVIDTINGFKSARDFSGGINMSTKIFGLVTFKNSRVQAIRHVITPRLSFNYHPDFGEAFWGYYKQIQVDSNGKIADYSIYENAIFGSPAKGLSGTIGLNIGNNLEMKVLSKNDTTGQPRKVKILDIFNVGTSYNLAADSVNMSRISISGNTRLFNNKLSLKFSTSLDPYISDSNNVRLNKFEWDANKRLARMTRSDLSLSTSLNSKTLKRKDKNSDEEDQDSYSAYPYSDVDFSIPWNFNMGYNFIVTHNFNSDKVDTFKITQSVSFGANINLTPKWKIGVRSGYDFVGKEITYTLIDIYRDMHCWEMKFEWVPPGLGKSYYNIKINAKANLLKDLKFERRKDWYDY